MLHVNFYLVKQASGVYMIHWDGNKGAFDHYEILIVPEPNHLWSLFIWVRKTLIDRRKGIYTIEEAQEIAEERVERLFKDAKAIEKRIYEEEEEEEEF